MPHSSNSPSSRLLTDQKPLSSKAMASNRHLTPNHNISSLSNHNISNSNINRCPMAHNLMLHRVSHPRIG